ncbi:MAG TPA: DUF3417 domain-containing protein, partial [Chloroflexota bacterium]|nr:DUF3417 domain-containing protein [Chloroflexota bacterium]
MSTRPLRTFTIVPSIPEALGRLRDVALNLRWAWDRESRDLFRRLDPELWEASRHNPVLMLGSVRQERLDEAAADDGFVAQYRRVCERLDEYAGTAGHNGAGRNGAGQNGAGGASRAGQSNGPRPWFVQAHADAGGQGGHDGGAKDLSVAYFSMEFGLTECLAIYSGGLGVLSGDHLKSASEIGLPLVAVGLLYRNGYFQQYLSSEGWQQEAYPEL